MRQNLSARTKQKGRGEGACQLDQEEAAVGYKMAALGLCLAKLGEKSQGMQTKKSCTSKNEVESTLGLWSPLKCFLQFYN